MADLFMVTLDGKPYYRALSYSVAVAKAEYLAHGLLSHRAGTRRRERDINVCVDHQHMAEKDANYKQFKEEAGRVVIGSSGS